MSAAHFQRKCEIMSCLSLEQQKARSCRALRCATVIGLDHFCSEQGTCRTSESSQCPASNATFGVHNALYELALPSSRSHTEHCHHDATPFISLLACRLAGSR